MDKEKEQYIREAGWGVAEFEACTEDAPHAFPMGQLVRVGAALAVSAGVDREHSRHAQLTSAVIGEVQIDPKKPHYIGARAHTNNTGEVTAMYAALCAALRRPRRQGREIVWSDSLYAINMTNGKWKCKSKRNRAIVDSTR